MRSYDQWQHASEWEENGTKPPVTTKQGRKKIYGIGTYGHTRGSRRSNCQCIHAHTNGKRTMPIDPQVSLDVLYCNSYCSFLQTIGFVTLMCSFSWIYVSPIVNTLLIDIVHFFHVLLNIGITLYNLVKPNTFKALCLFSSINLYRQD